MSDRHLPNPEVAPPAGQVQGVTARTSGRGRLVAAVVVLAVVGLLVWRVVLPAFQPPHHALPPAPVIVGVVTRQDVSVVEHTIGTVLAESTVRITPRVTGQLQAANFREGQIVGVGDLLFQIAPRPFQYALDQASATLAKDQADLVSAQNDAHRYTALFNKGAVSTQQRDQAVAKAKSLEAQVQADKAGLDEARLNLSYTKIVSPIAGKTGPILIQPGNQVTANASDPLVTITQIQPVKVSFFLPQKDLPRIQNQLAAGKLVAIASIDGGNGEKLTAPVDFVSNAVSAQTGTIELRATFANDDLRLVPGQTVHVGVTMQDLPGALVVPRDAVNVGPDSSYVFVVNAQSRAEMKPVTVLYDDGTQDAVSGALKPGDRVITEGQLRVVDGSSVEIEKNDAAAVARAPSGAQ